MKIVREQAHVPESMAQTKPVRFSSALVTGDFESSTQMGAVKCQAFQER